MTTCPSEYDVIIIGLHDRHIILPLCNIVDIMRHLNLQTWRCWMGHDADIVTLPGTVTNVPLGPMTSQLQPTVTLLPICSCSSSAKYDAMMVSNCNACTHTPSQKYMCLNIAKIYHLMHCILLCALPNKYQINDTCV
jgi:hypothetical protein